MKWGKKLFYDFIDLWKAKQKSNAN
jgi:hypothetical protein